MHSLHRYLRQHIQNLIYKKKLTDRMRLWVDWETCCASWSSYVRPQSLRHGILTIETNDGQGLHLHHQLEAMRQKICIYFGKPIVTRIILKCTPTRVMQHAVKTLETIDISHMEAFEKFPDSKTKLQLMTLYRRFF